MGENPFEDMTLENANRRSAEEARQQAQALRDMAARMKEDSSYNPLVQQPGESVEAWHRRLELIHGTEEVDSQFVLAHEVAEAKSDWGAWKAFSRWLKRRR